MIELDLFVHFNLDIAVIPLHSTSRMHTILDVAGDVSSYLCARVGAVFFPNPLQRTDMFASFTKEQN